MSQILLILAGVLGLAVAAVHGYLGQVRVIAPAKFAGKVQRGMALAIWQFSSLVWAASALAFVHAAVNLAGEARWSVVSLAILPLAYGMIANAWITRGRHFGWVMLALVIALALAGASGWFG